MANQWYIQIEGKVFGPFDNPGLARLAKDGRVNPDTPVRQEINGPWVRAERLKGLFAQPTIAQPTTKSLVPIITHESLKGIVHPQAVRALTSNEGRSITEAPYRTGYVTSNLLPGEHVVAWADTHWFIFAVPATLLLIPIVIAMAMKANIGPLETFCFSALFLPFWLFILTSRLVQYFFNQYAVTTKRVIMKKGFLSLQTLEVFHDKITTISVSQNFTGMIFNFGVVLISAMGDKQQFAYIDKPSLFRRRVQEMQSH